MLSLLLECIMGTPRLSNNPKFGLLIIVDSHPSHLPVAWPYSGLAGWLCATHPSPCGAESSPAAVAAALR